jgi:uroporphyrin-III C-methyltransferase
MSKTFQKVILAGAGPGDPDLITVRAAAALREADIILTDRLANKEILHRYASPHAEIIEVGKQAGKGVSTPQSIINQLLVSCAARAEKVVRLKGGDVSIFSNIADELETLRTHGIPYEIIPGITAAAGAAAYAGIPLTARDHARGVRLLTFHELEGVGNDTWQELARTSDTLVLYMSSRNLGELCQRLIAAGASADQKLALVEQATTPVQKVYVSTLEATALQGAASFLSPSLVIIGSVVGLHEKFQWFRNIDARISFFDPLDDVIRNSHSSPSTINDARRG